MEKIRDLRYGGSNEVLPDGSFSGLGSFQPKGDAVLTVTMSQPESYYLRGFIGSDYTGDGWKDTDAVKLWKSRDLFYLSIPHGVEASISAFSFSTVL